jgi:TatD DNase family protein
MFIDSHAHIDGPEFDLDREAVLARARAAGLGAILNVGTGDPRSGSLERAVALAEAHHDVYAAIGIHPHDARFFDSGVEQQIATLINGSSRILAWGEIGLDFHYDNSPREVQLAVFARQLELARAAGLPVIIHTRDAEAETIALLRTKFGGLSRPGIMHCFSGSLSLARQAAELGFLISFSGMLTFKKADDLREVARQLPLDQLLVETDCPFLAPVPFRGKRNEPGYVVEVARALAELHGVELETLARVTSENFARLFDLSLEALSASLKLHQLPPKGTDAV